MWNYKQINGYLEYYITDCGEVVSNKGKFLLVLKQSNINNGYALVGLSKSNKSTSHSVHRLVANAFLVNPDNLPQVNHIDGNKLNNHVSNLEWCTHRHNLEHAWRTGLYDSGWRKGRPKLTEEQVKEVRKMWPRRSIKDLGLLFGVHRETIGSIVNRRSWKEI